MGRRLWLDASGNARVDRRINRADDRGGRVHQAHRVVIAQAKHRCLSPRDEDGLCRHDRQAIATASRLLSRSLATAG